MYLQILYAFLHTHIQLYVNVHLVEDFFREQINTYLVMYMIYLTVYLEIVQRTKIQIDLLYVTGIHPCV